MHHFTLLDGEMIIDTLPDKQRQERRYLIYDMVAINGQSVVEVGTVFLSSIFNGWIGSLVLNWLNGISSRFEYVVKHIVNTVAAIAFIIEYCRNQAVTLDQAYRDCLRMFLIFHV